MRITLMLLLVAASCAPQETPAPRQTVTYDRRQEIRITAEPLESAVARSIIDAARPDGRDSRTSGWTYLFAEEEPVATKDGVSRPFRIRIDNRSDGVKIFDVSIEYFDLNGATARTRTLQRLVVPPFTRHHVEGQTLFPPGREVSVSGRVRLREDESS